MSKGTFQVFNTSSGEDGSEEEGYKDGMD